MTFCVEHWEKTKKTNMKGGKKSSNMWIGLRKWVTLFSEISSEKENSLLSDWYVFSLEAVLPVVLISQSNFRSTLPWWINPHPSPKVAELCALQLHRCSCYHHSISHRPAKRELCVGGVVFGLTSCWLLNLFASSLVWPVGFPLARYPTVIHPSASRRPMSDRACTLSEDREKKGCEYWIWLSTDEAWGWGFWCLSSLISPITPNLLFF